MKAMAKQIKLGQLQLQLMQVLWDRQQATARELTDEMSKSAPIAHSTVQTLLKRLEIKGAIKHKTDGRTFVFMPALGQEDVQLSAVKDMFRSVFRGSASLLVAHLIEHESISQDELKQLRELIDSKSKEKGE